jgi:hypothetical protein
LVAAQSPRLEATIMWSAATPFLPIHPHPHESRYVPFIRLVRFSFLILIGRFVTLDL